jgi:hypothetical protein
VILLNQIVQVFRGSNFGPLAVLMLLEEFPRRPMRGLIAVKRDLVRQPLLALERPPEKRFGGCDIPLGAEQKVDGLSFFIDRTIPSTGSGGKSSTL